jgi:PRC-barrel domain protein
MSKSIEDVSSLPGRKVTDQDEAPLGEVKAIFATDDGFPMWIEIETKHGLVAKERAVVPLARLKEEKDELRVQYSKQHVLGAPKPEDDCISADRDRELRIYYGIGTADQEMWSDNKGYVTLVPEEPGASKRVEDPDDLETPNDDKRTDETKERVRDPGSRGVRDVSAEDVFQAGADADDGT